MQRPSVLQPALWETGVMSVSKPGLFRMHHITWIRKSHILSGTWWQQRQISGPIGHTACCLLRFRGLLSSSCFLHCGRKETPMTIWLCLSTSSPRRKCICFTIRWLFVCCLIALLRDIVVVGERLGEAGGGGAGGGTTQCCCHRIWKNSARKLTISPCKDEHRLYLYISVINGNLLL